MATAHDASELYRWVKQGPQYPGTILNPLRFKIDFEELTETMGITIDPSAADTLAIWDIPVGATILGCTMWVLEACGDTGTATISIGDAGQAAGYMSAVSIKTAATLPTPTHGLDIGDAYGAAHFTYLAEGSLLLTFAGTATDVDSGVIEIALSTLFLPSPAEYAALTWK